MGGIFASVLRNVRKKTYATRVTTVPELRGLLARAGMRLVRVGSTDGSRLRRLRRDDPLPLAVACALWGNAVRWNLSESM